LLLRACRQSQICRDGGAHYDTVIVTAPPGKPRDKAKVESGVLLATRWIVAKLRNHLFFSLADLNFAIQGIFPRGWKCLGKTPRRHPWR
jgi:hypothetical protein